MDTYLIEDTQRLEELTEWCRNRPEEAAFRIMNAEGLSKKIPESQPEPLRLPVFVIEITEHAHGNEKISWRLPTTYRFKPQNACDINDFINCWLDGRPVIIGGHQVIIRDFDYDGEFFGEVLYTAE